MCSVLAVPRLELERVVAVLPEQEYRLILGCWFLIRYLSE